MTRIESRSYETFALIPSERNYRTPDVNDIQYVFDTMKSADSKGVLHHAVDTAENILIVGPGYTIPELELFFDTIDIASHFSVSVTIPDRIKNITLVDSDIRLAKDESSILKFVKKIPLIEINYGVDAEQFSRISPRRYDLALFFRSDWMEDSQSAGLLIRSFSQLLNDSGVAVLSGESSSIHTISDSAEPYLHTIAVVDGLPQGSYGGIFNLINTTQSGIILQK